jgi:hypothetical protein
MLGLILIISGIINLLLCVLIYINQRNIIKLINFFAPSVEITKDTEPCIGISNSELGLTPNEYIEINLEHDDDEEYVEVISDEEEKRFEKRHRYRKNVEY